MNNYWLEKIKVRKDYPIGSMFRARIGTKSGISDFIEGIVQGIYYEYGTYGIRFVVDYFDGDAHYGSTFDPSIYKKVE